MIVAATIPASCAFAMFAGLSSTSTCTPSSTQRLTLSNEQWRSSNGIPIASSQAAVASCAPCRRWLVTWIQCPASCQARTVSTAPG